MIHPAPNSEPFMPTVDIPDDAPVIVADGEQITWAECRRRFAFRLAAPSVERSEIAIIDEATQTHSGMFSTPPKPDVAGARERLFVAAYTGNADHVSVRKSDLRDQLETTDRRGEEIERLRERDEEIISTAVWLYRGTVSGVVSRDVRDGRMIRDEADAWSAYAISNFEEGLRDLTARARQGGPDHG